MNIPKRAGSAKLTKVKFSSAKSFGDITRNINSDKEKGNTARLWLLQSGEAVRCLLKAGAKSMAQQIDIIFTGLGFFQKTRIRPVSYTHLTLPTTPYV